MTFENPKNWHLEKQSKCVGNYIGKDAPVPIGCEGEGKRETKDLYKPRFVAKGHKQILKRSNGICWRGGEILTQY